MTKQHLISICNRHISSTRYHKMTTPNGMDELLWGKEFEDVHNWVERLKWLLK
jgi:hypothetical protein